MVAQKQAKSGEFLLIGAGHFVQQRLLAVHHLVVGQREGVIFRVGITDGKGQQIVIIRSSLKIMFYVA
ncbi:hypothetical protein D3C74_484300 [compost metagenome]